VIPIRTHYLLSPPYTSISCGTPETEPRMLGFGFLAQNPPPGLALANAWPTRHLRDTNPHPLPPVTTLHLHFMRHTRNRATNARFRVFGPKTHPPASHWRTRSPPAAFVISTRTYYLLEPPYTAVSRGVPETEPRLLGLGFLAKTLPPLPRVGQRLAHPPPPRYQPPSTASCHCPTPPFHAARPKPSHECSVSVLWPKTRLALVNP
jgi:hypothetical protein